MSSTIDTAFEHIALDDLADMPLSVVDGLPYGVVALGPDGVAEIYNATESRLAGLPPRSVLGLPFFEAVAQCMNNFLVAQRFVDEPELDAVVPFVLTLRMRPTPVRLRLLASRSQRRRYILIER